MARGEGRQIEEWKDERRNRYGRKIYIDIGIDKERKARSRWLERGYDREKEREEREGKERKGNCLS